MNSKTEKSIRESLKDKKRVVIKIGSSSLVHKETGRLDLPKIETLAREVIDIRQRCMHCFVRCRRGRPYNTRHR